MSLGKICGPNCSLCMLLLSVWGVVQLTIMGFGFFFEAAVMLEDLPSVDLPTKPEEIDEYYEKISQAYNGRAYNCWFAALLYFFLMVFSGHQYWINRKLGAAEKSAAAAE